MKNYKKLTGVFEEYYKLSRISSILSWDSQVNMPKFGFREREKQMNLLGDLVNEKLYAPETLNALNEVDKSKLSLFEKRNFFLMKRFLEHKTIVPEKLQKEITAVSLKSEFNWQEARDKKDFKLFNKEFSKLMKLLQEVASIKSEFFGVSKYESLMDEYDPGRKEKDLDEVFCGLKKELPSLIDKIISKQHPSSLPQKNYRAQTQKKFFTQIIKQLGISNNWCRIDESTHPFCTGYSGDVRITTRYDKADFMPALMGLIHESGHALYDNQMPKKYADMPIGQDAGMALHESQSLFFEMQVGRSKSFSKFITPKINKAFNLELTPDDLYANINKVEKSLIRVDADEATYPLHVILRYEIEKDLINGKIKSDDLPEVWNGKIKEYLGLEVPNDGLGCLQDIHWSDGSLGYFPSYSLGAIYAAQIKQAALAKIPNFDELVEAGKFKEITEFLKENIHKFGSEKDADGIVGGLCGKKLELSVFLGYLKGKYGV
jgi:carboxypeptidase Taq